MTDGGLIALITSIAGVILSSLILAIVKAVMSFVDRNMDNAFNVSKDFIRKSEFESFKNSMKRDMAVERVALQELLLSQLDKNINSKIKEFRNVGDRLLTIDETVAELERLRDDFKDSISSYNLLDGKVDSLTKEFNKMRYGTEKPTEEQTKRRRG